VYTDAILLLIQQKLRLRRSGIGGTLLLGRAWAERKTERSGLKTDLSGAERWAGKICRSKSAPPQNRKTMHSK